jgi:hypothetical protein
MNKTGILIIVFIVSLYALFYLYPWLSAVRPGKYRDNTSIRS